MKEINISKGHSVLVDDQDLERVNQYHWSFTHGYAVRNDKGRRIYLHRYIVNAPDNKTVDHINGNRLDNRRSNLRLCSFSENMRNCRKKRKDPSIPRGVFAHRKRFSSKIYVSKQQIYLGSFSTKEEAARAYDIASLKYHGEYGIRNEVL